MASLRISPSSLLLPSLFLILLLYARPTLAFGAGNIPDTSRIEGQNWRHGDIEDTLLALLISSRTGKKFSKMDVKRVYFGNWLRDYSQAVGTVKYVSAKAITLLLWILGFMSFGYGAREFQVTMDRLGCYQPTEHIDNPKDYADNVDARQYDRRLRGPVDERRELAIDEETGLKNYIANERAGIATSAGLIRNLFSKCIQLGREYNRTGNKDAQYEALRLLGTGCHCLEDYSAHSNYTELALIELGERDVFPHVGRRTTVQVRGARHPIYPIVTGTFGGVDFLHSVMGELSDKATQSEVQELEGTINQAQINSQNTSVLQELLSQVPDGIFGGKDQSGKVTELQTNAAAAQMQNAHISPREPEEWAHMLDDTFKQIYPIIEFHDDIMRDITETVEKIPMLPELLDNLSSQINIFVFSLLAPFVVPIIKQVKNELATGSSEIIQSSMEKQHIVFQDDNCSDPTHSMLSKDHFSNILNEPAGQIASNVLKWAVPQIVECWDNDSIDPRRTIERIIHGVFHHPALRDAGEDGASDGRRIMFQTVERWWQQQDQDDFRRKLSREGVERGENHKSDVHDGGHGCGKPLGMPGLNTAQSSGAPGGQLAQQMMDGLQSAVASGGGRPGSGGGAAHQAGELASEAVGGGLLGSVVGGLVGGVGGSLLGGAFNKDQDEHKTYRQEGYTQDGGYKTSRTETAHRPSSGQHGQQQYGQASYSQTTYPSGGRQEQYSRYEQDESQSGQRTSGYGYQHTESSGPTHSGGYERREEQTWERPGGQYTTETRREGYRKSGEYYQEEKRHSGRRGKENSDDDDDDDNDSGDDYEKKARKKAEKERKKREKEERKRQEKYGGGDDGGDDGGYGRRSGEYGSSRQEYGGDSGGYGGRQETSSYGGGRSSGYGGGDSGFGGGDSGYGGRDTYSGAQQSSYGGGRSSGYGGESYGRQEQSYGGDSGYGRRGGDDGADEQYRDPAYEERSERRQYGGDGGDGGGYGGDNGYGDGGSRW